MTDATTTATLPAPAQGAEPTTIWYPYAPLFPNCPLIAYTGTPTEMVSSAPQPANTSKWKPPTAMAGQTVYFNVVGWIVGIDVTKASVSDLQIRALRGATHQFQMQVFQLTSDYTPEEQSSWTQQLSEANLANGAPLTATNAPVLSALAAARSMDINELAQKVINKSNTYTGLYAKALATLQTQRQLIKAATSLTDLLPFLQIDGLT